MSVIEADYIGSSLTHGFVLCHKSLNWVVPSKKVPKVK